MDAWYPLTGLATALIGAAGGLLVPRVVARIPEPTPAAAPVPRAGSSSESSGESSSESSGESAGEAPAAPSAPPGQEPGQDPGQPKERYDAIAALPGLAWKCALVSALAAGLVGARLGWEWALLPLTYLVPVGVALGLVDWRTRLLPTRVIAPSYGVVVGLTVLAALLGRDWDDLVRAGWGWLLAGGSFFVLWFVHPRGMGYGDVRLSGLLGIALGYLGWGELVTGLYAGFLLGATGGTLLALLRVVDRKAYPFGPFMLVGALLGVLFGADVAAWSG